MYSSSRERTVTVEYQDVVPSTDLPPSIKGKPSCYLHIVIGKLSWKSCDCNDYKLPLPTSVYIRLRWWGDSTQGTFFRPQIEKCSRLIKCRAQYCVRSSSQQIAAYFKDMGSATFDVLFSPNSLPIGKALVSAIVSLSGNTSIRGSFPIKTSSGKIIGELQVAMAFKPRRCDCEEINLEALGTCKQLCYRSCPPRIKCFVRKQKELREGRINDENTKFCENSAYKGSACYAKLSATGKYGRRACVCDEEDLEVVDDSADGDYAEDYAFSCEVTENYPNKCKLLERCEEMMQRPETNRQTPDNCQVQMLNGLIQETKKLNKELVAALRCKSLDEECRRKINCSQGLVRVSIRALRLQASSARCNCCLDPCCPKSSQYCPLQGSRFMYMVEYKFPPQLVRPLDGQSSTACVKSNNLWTDGCVRFDESSVFAINFTPSALQNWICETLCFTVMRRDSNCAEPSILGRASLPLRCVVESPELFFCCSIPILSTTRRCALDTQTLGVLEVSIDVSCEGRSSSSFQCSLLRNPPVCAFKNTLVETCQIPNSCRYEKNKKSQSKPHAFECCDAKKFNKEISNENFFTPFCAFLYLFVEEAKHIPAVRLLDGSINKCFFPNVYLVCRGCFSTGNDDISKTRTVWNCHNPTFRFSDFYPLKVDENLLEVLGQKCVIIEVWTKVSAPSTASDKLLGLVRLPLTYFHEALQEGDVMRALSNLAGPLIAFDGFQPIYDVFSNENRGELKVLLALGTQAQINDIRKCSEFPEVDESVRSDMRVSEDSTSDECDGVEHVVHVTVHGLAGFVPCERQVSGKSRCFVQYSFPTQKQHCDVTTRSISMQFHKTSSAPCVRNLRLNHKRVHKFFLPPDESLERYLRLNLENCEKEMVMQVYTSQCCRKDQDKLLAKGRFPMNKLYDLLSSTKGKGKKEKFQVPMKFVKPCNKLAGDLSLTIKYVNPAPAPQASLQAAPEKPCNVAQMRFTLLQACGLKAGVRLLTGSAGMGGITTYAVIRTLFLPNPQTYYTRVVEDSYTPAYNYCVDLHLSVVRCDESSQTLAALLQSGNIEIKIWQKCSSTSSKAADNDVLLGEAKVPTRYILFKVKGYKSWLPLMNSCQQSHALKKVGFVQIAISFTSDDALQSILKGSAESGWIPPPGSDLRHFFHISSENSLKPIESFDTDENYATFRLNVTNAWLSKKILASVPGKDGVKGHSVYLRYKFHDQDSVTSSLRHAFAKSKKKNDDVINIKLAHQRAYVCEPGSCLFWYLRESKFEIQLWLTTDKNVRKQSLDLDVLVGSAFIELSLLLIGGLRAPQHICDIYPLFKPGSDDIEDVSIQICLCLAPGNDVKSYENTESDCDEISDAVDQDEKKENKVKTRESSEYFSAVVAVERAMYLPHHPPVINALQDFDVSFYVTFPVKGNVKEEQTKHVDASPSPVWNDAKEVRLDRGIFDQKAGKIVFRIWQKHNLGPKSVAPNDHVIGFATVDLSVLLNGFHAVTGWYNVLDIFGRCRGEIKIGVTPTDPMQLMKINPTVYPWSSYRSVLHSVPLLTPVVSHLGSVYYPGVSNCTESVAMSFLNEQRPDSPRETHLQFYPTGLHKNLTDQISQLDQLKNKLKRKLLIEHDIPVMYPPTTEQPITVESPNAAQPIKMISSEILLTSQSSGSSENSTETSSSAVLKSLIPSGCSVKNNPQSSIYRQNILKNEKRFSLVGDDQNSQYQTLAVNFVNTCFARVCAVSDFSASKSFQSIRKSKSKKSKASHFSKLKKKNSKPHSKHEERNLSSRKNNASSNRDRAQ